MVKAAGLAMAAIAAMGMTTAASQTSAAIPRVIASNGAVIDMPDIASLDCAGMERTLRVIDLSQYRGPGPVPDDHPDRPIFEYEDRLSASYYHACTLERHRLEDPGPAFSFGFAPQ